MGVKGESPLISEHPPFNARAEAAMLRRLLTAGFDFSQSLEIFRLLERARPSSNVYQRREFLDWSRKFSAIARTHSVAVSARMHT